MNLMKFCRVVVIIGLFITFLSAILLLTNGKYSEFVGIVSTIISIVLGFVSIVYTYISGQDTLKTLNEIRNENSKLVEKINYELSKNNYDETNINTLLKK